MNYKEISFKAASLSELAAMAGVSVTTLSKWIKLHPKIAEAYEALGLKIGKVRMLPPYLVQVICDVLGIDYVSHSKRY